ncbi:MAG: response regulator, partial [Proteobacteria bacterium]
NDPNLKQLILVVDDTPGTRYSVARVLKNDGFEVIEAGTGTDGLRLATERLPDLAILDIHLPDMTGFEVCRRIKSEPTTAAIPVLQISASFVTAKDKVNGLEGGADNYLTHPVEPQVLVATVRALLRLRDLNRNLQKIDERLQIALQVAPIGLMEFDTDLKLKWIHFPRSRKPVSEMIGKRIDEIIPSASSESLVAAQKEVLLSGESRRELLVSSIDGETRSYDFTLNVLKNALGAKTGLSGTIIDVTERELAKTEIERAKNAAEAANNAKSQFIANISHEIRTPLGVIMGFSDLVLDGGQTRDENMASVGVIRRNAIQLSKLVDEVLDLAKIEADRVNVEMIRFDLIELVEDVVSLMSLRANEKSVDLVVKFEPILPRMITSDPTRLRQILINMIGNAVKFTERGQVKVFVGVQGRVIENQPLTVSIEVTDTGIGITEDQAAHLFNAFSQGDASMNRRFGGTGLGLMLSRKLAEALGGGLELTSSVQGQGATFTATVVDPKFEGGLRSADQLPKLEKVVGTGKSEQLNGIKVLLVEDAPDNQVMIKRFLSFAGGEVDIANDGEAGVAAAIIGKYDVILMDIQMPIMNGYEAAHKLRELGYKKPIIALTAHALKGERERCLEA